MPSGIARVARRICRSGAQSTTTKGTSCIILTTSKTIWVRVVFATPLGRTLRGHIKLAK